MAPLSHGSASAAEASAALPALPHIPSSSYRRWDSQDQMVSQVREKILNDLHSTKKVVSLKNEALALTTDVKKNLRRRGALLEGLSSY